jgi:hypothetical protein
MMYTHVQLRSPACGDISLAVEQDRPADFLNPVPVSLRMMQCAFDRTQCVVPIARPWAGCSVLGDVACSVTDGLDGGGVHSRRGHWYLFSLVVKCPAADATDALQPWGLFCNPVMKITIIFCHFPSNGAPVEWNWQGKTEVLGEKPVPVPLCPPQIPHALTRGHWCYSLPLATGSWTVDTTVSFTALF